MDKKVPKSFKNREELIKFLTMVIFTCSCQHAAVNFSQMATYGYHPNSPTLMRKPAPTKRGQVDSSFVMETLANKHQAGLMVATVKALTTVYPSEVNDDSNTMLVCDFIGCDTVFLGDSNVSDSFNK